MTVTPDTLVRAISERQLQDAIVDLAGWLGFHVYHTHDSRHSTAGYPDLTLVKPGRFIMVELKRETGRLSAAQQVWLDELAAAGVETYVWRPSAWRDGTVERVLRGQE